MLFHSTRGLAPPVDLRAAAMAGLAPDGGLYLPQTWPAFPAQDFAALRGATYAETAFAVLRPFVQGVLTDTVLRGLIDRAYADFTDSAIAPLRRLDDDFYVLELFHGPTLAFKDIALQLLGPVFEHFLQETDRRMTVIGATSGDTGSAAIAALANRANVDVFILYPDKGPSDIQSKQMTCVDAPNVHAVAVAGSFDDCQALVKTLFADEALRAKWNLNTVNSINFLRILAQIVYYVYAAVRLETRAHFVVPTGNFGDVFAGYAARRCGLPMGKLVVASNSNDILTRFFATGRMTPEGVCPTLSPSMDIQISSNFERLLFDLCAGDGAHVRASMADLQEKGAFAVSADILARARQIFAAGRADDAETLATIAEIHAQYGYVLDPHTAVGVKVAKAQRETLDGPVVCLATAHPAKFPETLVRALGFAPDVPAPTAALIAKPEHTALLPADKDELIRFIEERK